MTLVEAMNYGLAILTTSYAGIDDLVQDGYNGIICKNNSLFEYFDPYHMVRHDLSDQVMLHSGNDPRMIQDFVEKAEMLMRDPELRKSLAQNAQKTLEQGEYSFQQNNEKRKNIYDRLT
jgi:glycosyltransferase involved in cell wall biosynthesis